MSDAHPPTHPDTAADHHDDHLSASPGGHDDDHGTGHEHADEALGPIDVVAWGAGALGILVGGVTALAFVLSTGRL
jgi:hypothetical protein